MPPREKWAAPESPAKRWSFLALALAITYGYFFFIHSYGGPAHPGVDQNGYQYGGRLFAQTLSTGVKPANDFVYVGWMWIRTTDGWYYPKYPLGLPVIDAICLWTAPIFDADGVAWVYLVSPIAMAMSVVAMFLMTRLAAGSFAGILAMILLATSPVTLLLANSSNSHAPALALVTWGVLFLLWWWKSGGAWRGAIAGFLLGYAVTIRYTEGLLLLPLLIVVVMKLFQSNTKARRDEEPTKKNRSYLSSFLVRPSRFFASSCSIFIPLLSWSIPVAILLIYNKCAMGSWTGYDTTNESTGFSMKNFQDKWDFMLEKLHGTGLFFLLPIAVLGLVLMFRSTCRLALVMTAWFVPGVLLYTAYYWGNDLPGMAYMRFFLTLFPPAIFATAWMFGHLSSQRSIAAPIAAGIVVAIASGVNLSSNLGGLERDFAMQTNLAEVGRHIRSKIPDESDPSRRPILFGEQRQLLNYIQWVGNYECYAQDAFNTRFAQRIASGADPDAPNPLQRARIQHTAKVYKGKSDAELVRLQNKLMIDAILRGRRVFVALPAGFVPLFKNRYLASGFTTITIDKWRDPVEMSAAGKKALANMGFAAGAIYGRGTPQNWELLEIKRK